MPGETESGDAIPHEDGADRFGRRAGWVMVPFCVFILMAAGALLYAAFNADLEMAQTVMEVVKVGFGVAASGLAALFLYTITEEGAHV